MDKEAKKCSKCGEKKPLTEFNKKTKTKLQTYCKICNSLKCREYYNLNKDKQYKQIKAAQKIRSFKIKEMIFDYLSNHPCINCGEKDPVVLEFDHLDNKKYNVSVMIGMCLKIEKIQSEIDKCVILCANCHRRKTAKTYNW